MFNVVKIIDTLFTLDVLLRAMLIASYSAEYSLTTPA